MATSKVAIANLALQKLGAKRISSLSQDHPNARSMNAAYEHVRQKELRAYEWGFATRRASIAADASQTTWGTHNRYTLPDDYLYLLLDDETGAAVDWHIEAGASGEGAFIITDDDSPLQIKYVADIDDPTHYDSLFREVFACALALHCCQEITESSAKEDRIRSDYQFAINRAMAQGAIEKPATDFAEDDWILARL